MNCAFSVSLLRTGIDRVCVWVHEKGAKRAASVGMRVHSCSRLKTGFHPEPDGTSTPYPHKSPVRSA